MFYFGIDVHKKVLFVSVMDQNRSQVFKRRFYASEQECLLETLRRFSPCKVTFEASGCSEWLIDLLRPEVEDVVLAHPGRLRLISQTVKKTDKIDARILAELLAMDYVPRAYIASPQEREDRALVRTHRYLARSVRGAKQRVRAGLNRHNWRSPDVVRSKFALHSKVPSSRNSVAGSRCAYAEPGCSLSWRMKGASQAIACSACSIRRDGMSGQKAGATRETWRGA